MLPSELEAFVREARSGHLGTVDQDGRPHVVPVCFAYQDGVAYIALDAKPKSVPARRLRRVRNIVANPRVQLLVDRYDEDWSKLRFVQLRGAATLIEGGDEHDAALVLLRAKYAQYASMPLEQAPVIRIAVQSHVTWDASGAAPPA